jgi:hypothetical protein
MTDDPHSSSQRAAKRAAEKTRRDKIFVSSYSREHNGLGQRAMPAPAAAARADRLRPRRSTRIPAGRRRFRIVTK